MKISRREKTNAAPSSNICQQRTLTTIQSSTSQGNASNVDSSDKTPVVPSVKVWEDIFLELLNRPLTDDIAAEFDDQVEKCAEFLHQASQHLKGPKHPNTKFYEARRAGSARKTRPGFHRTSNPSRRDKRRREAARERYQYDLTQYQYYNVRRQAVRTVLNSQKKGTCRIPVSEVEKNFEETLGQSNDFLRDFYDKNVTSTDDSDTITEAEIHSALTGMAIDTCPGLDKVLLRAVKSLKCDKVLSLIATLMYQRTLVPKTFKEGRTVLLPKDGDLNVLGNWRRITIFSVLRRVIERVLDRRLRQKVIFNASQRGFVNVPGTHLNSSIVDGVLRDAKKKKKSGVVVFLDVSKAFDNIGHEHIKRTLESFNVPEKLRNIIQVLCEENSTSVHMGSKHTRRLRLKRGVPQGAPLSPALFNLCIDFILKELTDEAVARKYGYTLTEDLSPLTALAFADDIVILAKDEESARRLVELATRGLQTIGLNVNNKKSQAIVLQRGQLLHLESGFSLSTGESFPTLQPGERIRYLGVDFEHEIVFDEVKTLRHLKDNLDLLTASSLLHPDQKLNVVNNFIWPALIYPLQTAPLHKISKGFLNDVDMLIRGAVKQFCNLPMDTPNAMVYSPQKHRGLGVIRAIWEAYLQHINIARRLEQSNDPHLFHCRDLAAEETDCLQKLGFPEETTDLLTAENSSDNNSTSRLSVRDLRTRLRNEEYTKWCALPSKGRGVELFAETPTCNKWVTARSGLSTSEWVNALKMSCNDCNLRSNPRNTSGTSHCRHCSEFESLGHVLGKCPRGELLRNRRHHRVCDTIAASLQQMGYTVLREDKEKTENHGTRFSDLVVIDSQSDVPQGYILDPTVRLERSQDQALEVDEEKRTIYEPTLPAYKERFPDVTSWQVSGLLFGARGAIPRFTAQVLTETLGMSKHILVDLSVNILKDSLGILHHHMYSRDN